MLHSLIIEGIGTGNLLVLVYIGFRLSQASGTIRQIMRDFPPHRHVDGRILYPRGYEPEHPYEKHH